MPFFVAEVVVDGTKRPFKADFFNAILGSVWFLVRQQQKNPDPDSDFGTLRNFPVLFAKSRGSSSGTFDNVNPFFLIP